MKLKLKEACFELTPRFSKEPTIFYQYGYLWIGNDGDHNKACFGTSESEVQLKKFCDAISKDLAKRLKRAKKK